MLTFISLTFSCLPKIPRGLVVTISPSAQAVWVQSRSNPFFFHCSATAIPTSSKMCNLIYLKRFFFPSPPNKQIISIKHVTPICHVYVTLTLQTFIWLAVLFYTRQKQRAHVRHSCIFLALGKATKRTNI